MVENPTGINSEKPYLSKRFDIQNLYQRYHNLGRGKLPTDKKPLELTIQSKTFVEIEDYLSTSPGFVLSADEIAKKSPEKALDFIYFALLNRKADKGGKQGYKELLRKGRTTRDIITDIRGSDEFYLRMLQLTYQQVLGRDPDPYGQSAYLTQLQRGENITNIVNQIKESEEAKSIDDDTAKIFFGNRSIQDVLNEINKKLNAKSRLFSRRAFLLSAGAVATTAFLMPDAKKYRGELLNDVLMPRLYEEVKAVRSLRSKNPEWAKRIDPKINRDRVNFLVLGVGSEKDNQYTDTFLLASYSLKDHQISLFSIPRDTHAPEIDRTKKRKGMNAPNWNAVNTAFAVGGFDLAKEVIEDATGLSADFVVKFRIEAIIELVDKVYGSVDIKVEEDINDTSKDVRPLKLEKGKTYKMDGNLLQDYLRSRSSTSEISRNLRQQRAIEQLFEIYVDRFKKGDIGILSRSFQTFDILQKHPDKRLESDVKVDRILMPELTEIPKQARNLIGSIKAAFGAGRFPSISKPNIRRTVFQPGHEPDKELIWESRANQVRPFLLSVKGGNYESPDLTRGYWKPLRDQVRSALAA